MCEGTRWCVGCGRSITGGFVSWGKSYLCLDACSGMRMATGTSCPICKAVAGRACTDLNTRQPLRFPHASRKGEQTPADQAGVAP